MIGAAFGTWEGPRAERSLVHHGWTSCGHILPCMKLREVIREMFRTIALMRRASIDADVAEGLLPASFREAQDNAALMARFQVCSFDQDENGSRQLRTLPEIRLQRLGARPVL